MNKPVTLVIEETKTKLAEIINTSGLPPFVIEPMLNTFLQEAHIASKRQYEIDKLQYEQAIAKRMRNIFDVLCGVLDKADKELFY